MKANYYKLNAMSQVLTPLLRQKLPVKAAYWLNKFGEAVFKELDSYEKKRLELLPAYAEMEAEDSDKIKIDEKGEAVFESEEIRQTFIKEVDAQRLVEVEIPITQQLTVGNLGNAEMSPSEFAVLDELFKEEAI